MLGILVAAVLLITSLCFGIEPQHEYEKPGYNPGHAYDGVLPEETIDLFTGGLSISQRDVKVSTIKVFEDFDVMVKRHYSSKIFRQESVSGACNPYGTTIDDEFVGLGWTLHFGRLWDPTSMNPILELPDGSRHMFYDDIPATLGTRKVSKSGWVLKAGTEGTTVFYDALSPNTDSLRIRFYNMPNYLDNRNGSTVLHADTWHPYTINYSTQQVRLTFSYERDASGHQLLRALPTK